MPHAHQEGSCLYMDMRFAQIPSPGQVKIGGAWMGGILEGVRNKMLPFQWEVLNDAVPGVEKSHCIDNFRIAAGLIMGSHYGFVFQDSDLAKWLEAAAYQLHIAPDPSLEEKAEEAISLIEKAQLPDGYLNTYYQLTGIGKRWTNLRDCHELYCAGHMLEAAVAYYEATGRRRLLDVMIRNILHIESVLGTGEGKLPGYPGHEEIELALCKLYDVTGEERFLRLAAYFIDQRGQLPHFFVEEMQRSGRKDDRYLENLGLKYAQAHLPVREQKTMEGHAVRALYLATGMTDVALRTRDESLWGACKTLFENVTQKRMYITGGVGSTHHGEAFSFDYDLPNDTVYAETCASIALVFFCQRLLRGEQLGVYGDIMEQTLYNTCMAGMRLDQKAFFYVNPLSVYPEASHKDPGKKHVLPERPAWFGCACCPPNLARLLSSIGTYQYAMDGKSLYVHLYIEGEASLSVNGQPVHITMKTDYPFEEEVRILPGPGEYDLKLRLPGWCKKHLVLRNGEDIEPPVENGYMTIRGPFAQDEEILLHMDMPPRRVYAHINVREDIGKVALMRGPLVYCLEERDNGAKLHCISLPRNAPLAPAYDSMLLGGTPVIRAEGACIVPTDGALYNDSPAWREEKAPLTFIPYFLWANRGENEMEVWVREKA